MYEEKEVPFAPMKKYPRVSRLSEEEKKYMDEVEAYDAEPVDLDTLGELPLGDEIPEGYSKLSMMKGKIGGRRKSKKTRKMKGKKGKKGGKKSMRKMKTKRNTMKRKGKKGKKTMKYRRRSMRK